MRKVLIGVLFTLAFGSHAHGQGKVNLVSDMTFLRSNHWYPTFSADTMYLDSLHTCSVVFGNAKSCTTAWYPWTAQWVYGFLWFQVSAATAESTVDVGLRKEYSPDKTHIYIPKDSIVVAQQTTEATGKYVYFNSSVSGETSTTMPDCGYFRFRFIGLSTTNKKNCRVMAYLGYSQ